MDSLSEQLSSSSPTRFPTLTPKSPLDTRIEEMNHRANNLALNLAAELPCLYFSDADTLVFLDPPDGGPLKDSMCGLFVRPPYRIHSSKILATNSTVLKE